MTAFVVYRYTNIFREWALSFLFSRVQRGLREHYFPMIQTIHFGLGRT